MKGHIVPHDHHSDDDHDLGFAHDLPRLIGRRGMLAILGGAGMLAATPSYALDCVALPWETAGPFPADGSNTKSGQVVNALTQAGVIRRDLRPSFNGMTGTAQGVPLELELVLTDAAGCGPLAGHAIYLWHCDGAGKYSLYDYPAANFLRGVGISDDAGVVRFTTIVPGCYDGRWPHFHFEVFDSAEAAVSGAASRLTAQIALPEDDMKAVYQADSRYVDGLRNLGRISFEGDMIFGDNTKEQQAQQMLKMQGTVSDGYAGAVTIPIDLTLDAGSLPTMPGPFGAPRKP